MANASPTHAAQGYCFELAVTDTEAPKNLLNTFRLERGAQYFYFCPIGMR